MQTSYGFSGLVPYDTSEARVGGNSCRQSFRATRTSSWMLTGIVKCFKAHLMPTQTATTCQNMPKHATAMFMLVNEPVKNSVYAKVSKEVRNLTVGCAEHWPNQPTTFQGEVSAHYLLPYRSCIKCFHPRLENRKNERLQT